MSDSSQSPVATPDVKQQQKTDPKKPRPRKQPPYNVILHDDDDHSPEYVIEMLGKIFGHSVSKAFKMAEEVDSTGRVIVDTTTLERAELKRDQIHGYGKDFRLPRCKGSMRATIEPAEEG